MTGVLSIPPWGWAATIGVLTVILGTEFAVGIRRGARTMRLRYAAGYTAAVTGLAILFGLAVGWLGHPAAASQFFAGWLTEYSLSLDNLFIFVLLIGRSAVPRELHGRVLLLGVAMALILRGSLIAVGAAAVSRFSWVMYLLGVLLICTAVRLAFGRPGQERPRGGRLLRGLARVVPVSPECRGGSLIGRIGGRRAATPLLFLIIGIAATDVVFALDSIPAIFGLTRDPYLVFTANAFALLGLRQLYFLIGGLLSRLRHLPAGLAVILAFISVKLITEALADSGVRSAGPVPVPHISTGLSLAVIGSVIILVTVTSLLAGRQSGSGRTKPAPPSADSTGAAPPGRPAGVLAGTQERSGARR